MDINQIAEEVICETLDELGLKSNARAIKTSIAERAPITQLVVKFLLENAEPEKLITYEQFLDEPDLHYDVKANRGPLYRALNYLRQHHQMVFDCCNGKGYKLVANERVADHTAVINTKKVDTAVTRWKSDLHTVNLQGMNADQIKSFSMSSLKAAILEESLKQSQSPELEEKVSGAKESLEILANTANILKFLKT